MLEHINEGLPTPVDPEAPLSEKLFACLFDLVNKFCDVPLMVKYVLKFHDHPELYTDAVKAQYAKVNFPLDTLCKEAIATGQAKTSDLMLMHVMLLSPITRLFDYYEGRENQFDPQTYTECIRLSIDSVLS